MKIKLLTLLSALLLPLGLVRAQQLDSTRLAPLDSMLHKYYDAMLLEPLEVKYQECDFLISACQDSLVRQWVATRILEHYMDNPPLMGEEAVAVYLYEKWFATEKIVIADPWAAFVAAMFVEFNRNSLLGMEAPEIMLRTPTGSRKIRVPDPEKISVLYFYDTSCSKCQATSIMLPYVMEEVGVPLTLYMIYTGNDVDEWAEYRSGFSVPNPNVETVHLWDPEMESDYQQKYAVISTPQMFLVRRGIIEGRRLEVDSLKELLNIYSLYSANNGKAKKPRR